MTPDAAPPATDPAPVDVTVVVLSWNTRALTLRALAAAPAACAPFAARVVCVDNASHDGTVAAVRRTLPEVVVVENPTNLGFARGNNAALDRCAGRAIAFLNSDTEARPGSLAPLLRYLDAHPTVGIVAPPLVGEDGAPQRTAWGLPTTAALLHQYTPLGWLGVGRAATDRQREAGRTATTGPVPAVSGAALMIRHALCVRLGGFDPGYPFYVEDVDLCWRARRLGADVHVVADGPPVVHRGGASAVEADGATRLPLLVGILRLQRKRLSPWAYASFALAFKTGVVVRSSVDALRAPLVAAVRTLRGRRDRARRGWRTARDRVRFLEQVRAFLRA